MKCSHKRKETKDNTNGRRKGDGISMVLGEGKKPGGEEVSVRLVYAPSAELLFPVQQLVVPVHY